MTKKKKHKKQNSRKTIKVSPKNYELVQYGPLKLERIGRFVRMTSEWDPAEHRKYIETVKSNREPFRQEIDEKIRELFAIAGKCDPLELLSTVAIRNVFADPERYKESTHEGRENYVEYALSIALSVSNPRLGEHATADDIERFNALIAEVFSNVIWYFGLEGLDDDDKSKLEIRYMTLMHYLMVRGDSYAEHNIDLVRGVFEPHDRFLKDSYGFGADDVIRWIETLESQVQASFNRHVHFAAKLREMHEIFKKFLDDRGADSFSTMEACLALYDSLPEVQSKKKELEKIHQELDYFVFEVSPNEDLPAKFLDLLSAHFGDNESFASFERSPGWPTNDSIIHRRPLIAHGGKYFCFSIQMLHRNMIGFFEALIRETDSVYFETTYQKARGMFLVRKALEYFATLLPGAEVYEGLYYRMDKDGQNQRFETDGIILFDTNLLVIEGKAGSLSTSARRGALPRLKRDMTVLVDNAYAQALRTRAFINEAEKPRFEYENGTQAFVIENKQMFKNSYLINVTLESLWHLSAHLNSLKILDLLKGREWPWSVFLNDLRVISEVVETPSEFLVYLQRRLRANDFPQFNTADELDFLMYYFYEGLYFEDNKLHGLDVFRPHAYTEDLDRYYDHKAGRVSTGPKPRLRIPEAYKTFIKRLEATGKQGFSDVAIALLGFDTKPMEDILKYIERAKDLSLRDGGEHDFTLIFSSSGLGLTVSVSSNRKANSIKRISRYCSVKMYQQKLSKWIFLAIDLKDNLETCDFRFFDKEWAYDPRMEDELRDYRRNKLDQAIASGRRPSRNDPCPCNSGLKYKKCCGKGSEPMTN